MFFLSVSSEEYKKLGDKAIPPTNSFRNFAGAFLIGGGICALGQILTEFFRQSGFSVSQSNVLCTLSLVALSALLTGLGIYDKLAKFGGGGTLIPITGFANAVVSPAMEFKSEGWILGLGVKIFSIAGPVLVYGLSASVIYGVILWLIK